MQMIIREMFVDNINRPINGVIKVDQDAQDVIDQEVREYVITKELKKHFISFFDYYNESYANPTDDIGVWISGFFGSGKSHFLKMLSYILENKEVNGVKTVELFREKFADDPATFMLVDNATKGQTETILFNIDIEGLINKDKTAVLRVFAKMFYNHLGFYGENLKVAMLEKYIDKCGKTEEFRRVFEEKKGKSWVDQRKAFAFNGKSVVSTLVEVLDMSERDAQNWFEDKSSTEFSIAQLVSDIKEYISGKPDNFRLLFMIDEAGQYVGTDTDMLLNLQSITEKIGSECGGKVWVICTGQEAIDEIIKVRADEFSRIQARFKTRLSLTSSSVDEVVQKRILKKKPEIEKNLEYLYNDNESVLRNLFSFSDSILDIKGYGGPGEFSANFPFVPYQFIIMQKVFNEIRKHGNAGKHQSNGERSMLSGFQEAAQKVQNNDEYALVPFYDFYDTLHSFLDSSIRGVIERCQKAADTDAGIKQYDVNVLKLLYLVRYVDDIKANLDNIVILMADDIRTDKINLRKKVSESLDRLLSQNYIGRTNDTYNFLTDEEQEIQIDIKRTPVDTASVIDRISQLIYGDIFDTKKFRYGKYDFEFDKMVDGVINGNTTGGMKLRFLTVAADGIEKNEMRLMTESMGMAVAVLADTPYYESLENSMKIRKYIKQKNVTQLPKSVQDIIRSQADEANAYDRAALEALIKAIENAEYYVDGEHLTLKGGNAKSKIEQALEYLVVHVYSELDLIRKNAETDSDITEILDSVNMGIANPNQDAAAKIEEHLEMRFRQNMTTSMADIQSRYQAIPYGWREIDIAAVVALLIHDQKVTVKYAGNTIQPGNPKLADMLRKKTETGKTIISIRQSVSQAQMKEVKDFLRDYFDVMDVPNDEDGLVEFISSRFSEQKNAYSAILENYSRKKYPGKDTVGKAIDLISDILSQQKDNIAFVSAVIKREDDLYDSKDSMQSVGSFFKNQVKVYDEADRLLDELANDLDYLSFEKEANNALNRIRLLIRVSADFDYKCIPELNNLMMTVHEGHNRLLVTKREEINGIIRQCMEAIHTSAGTNDDCRSTVAKADDFYTQKKQRVGELKSLALLDGLIPPMLTYKDEICLKIEAIIKPDHTPSGNLGTPRKIIKSYSRQIVFPAKHLESEADLDAYIEQVRKQLKTLMQGCDGIELK